MILISAARHQLKQLLLVIFLTGMSFISISQASDSLRGVRQDGYIQKMSNSFAVKLAVTNDIEAFSVDAKPYSYELYPNTSTITRLFLNYRILSFAFSFKPAFIPGNDDNDIKGKTKSGGFGFGLNFSRLNTHLAYHRTKGYYLGNSDEVDPTWMPGDPYLQVPELVTKSFEGETKYTFNPRFSQTSLITQTERQLKSAGSFIPKLFYRYYIVDDRSMGTTQKSNNFLVTLGVGYYYTLVIKNKVYVSAGLTPAFGFISTRLLTRYSSGNEVTHSTSSLIRLDGQCGIGYNGQKFFGGAYLSARGSSYRQENTTAVTSNARAAYQLFIGYRFTAPKALREKYDETSEKIAEKIEKVKSK